MLGRPARSVVAALAFACGLLAPHIARADDAADRIAFDTRRLEAEDLVRAADHGGAGAVATYAKAAQIYEELYRASCSQPRPAGSYAADPRHCEEVAFNAARAFRAATDVPKSIALLRLLVEADARAATHSALAAKATYEIGASFQGVAQYEEAAQWYERYAQRYPKAAEADRALADAIVLRLGLSQPALAIADANRFLETYGGKRSAESANVVFAVGAHYAENEAWDKARDVLSHAMTVLDRAPLDLRIQAHVVYARALRHSPTPALARAEYRLVRALWRDPAQAEAALRAARSTEDVGLQDRRLAKTLNAIGEAAFFEAEERRAAEVEPLKAPAFMGAAGSKEVQTFVNDKVRPWFEKKRRAIEMLERAYLEILEVKPVPPPKWVIAASATVGATWGSFADELRKVPVADVVRRDKALYKTYVDALDAVTLELKNRTAKPAMVKCINLSVKYQYVDPRTRVCERWLVANYGNEFHAVEEFVPPVRSRVPWPMGEIPFGYDGIPVARQ